MNKAYYTVFAVILISMIYFYLIDRDYYKQKCEEEHTIIRYIKASHSGLIRGMVIGILLGDYGLVSGMTNGAVYGILNPVMVYFGY
jgi:hypothetical protein